MKKNGMCVWYFSALDYWLELIHTTLFIFIFNFYHVFSDSMNNCDNHNKNKNFLKIKQNKLNSMMYNVFKPKFRYITLRY